MRAINNWASASVDIHVLREEWRQGPVVVEALAAYSQTFEFRQIEEGSLPPAAPFRLQREHAQQLMDDLYRAGLRPHDAQATAGQVEALQAHLADLRLAYTTLLARVQQGGTL
jgi:hypothetical protein